MASEQTAHVKQVITVTVHTAKQHCFQVSKTIETAVEFDSTLESHIHWINPSAKPLEIKTSFTITSPQSQSNGMVLQ